jgi:hypothetical protein
LRAARFASAALAIVFLAAGFFVTFFVAARFVLFDFFAIIAFLIAAAYLRIT